MLRRQLYRSLMRQAIKFDRNPRMKAFIFTNEATFPSNTDENVPAGTSESDPVNNAMSHIVKKYCSPGIFYKPQQSVVQLVRDSFRKPPLDLNDDQQLNQLGFLALRRFFSCEAIAKHLTIFRKDVYFEPVKMEPVLNAGVGSILVSHPLHAERDYCNSVILVTHTNSHQTSGICLNRQSGGDFKSHLTRKEIVQYGSFLKHFYSMPCFRGGIGRITKKRKINFGILHQQDSLAAISERIDLPSPSAEGEQASSLYLSTNFQAIGREIAAGRIKTSDLKIVQGSHNWKAGELQQQLVQHQFFPVSTPVAAQISMQLPAPDDSSKAFWSDPEVWYSGPRSWYKILHLMGGEYRDFARLKCFHFSKEADLYVNVLNALPTGKDYMQDSLTTTLKALGSKVARLRLEFEVSALKDLTGKIVSNDDDSDDSDDNDNV